MQETLKTKNGYHEQVIENNQVTVMGEVVSEFSFSHEIFGEGFYMVDIQVARLSESMDIIPVMISERLLDVNGDYRGMMVVVNGQFRSYNRHEEHKNKLVLSVFAREIEFVEEISENIKTNQIFLDGFVCKEPVYRKTPLVARLRTCFWQSTVHTANLIIFPASAGGEMPDTPRISRWESVV